MSETSQYHFLADPPLTDEVKLSFDEDMADDGYVMNLTRLWAYQPEVHRGLFELLGAVARAGDLSYRQRGVLVASGASTLGDAYCSLAWGNRLAGATDPIVAGGVLTGDDSGLEPRERAMAVWARKVAGDPIGIGEEDIEDLRSVGLTDPEIFAITLFVALRLAFSTVNNALGARPDRELADAAPEEVLAAVKFGRPVATTRSGGG